MDYRPAEQVDVRLPTAVYPAGPVETYVSPGPVVWVPDAYGRLVPMPKDLAPAAVQATPARDLTPQPLIDPLAQRVVASGVFAAGAGWGVGQVVSAFAGISSGLIMWLAIAIVAARVGGGRGTSTVHNETTVHNHNRWWGQSRTTNSH